MKRPTWPTPSTWDGINHYVTSLENYCTFLEKEIDSMQPDPRESITPIMCSIHKDREATWKSKHTADLFYCSKCSDYVAEVYGIHRIQRLEKVECS